MESKNPTVPVKLALNASTEASTSKPDPQDCNHNLRRGQVSPSPQQVQVLIRYRPQTLFGPKVACVTEDRSALFTAFLAKHGWVLFYGMGGSLFEEAYLTLGTQRSWLSAYQLDSWAALPRLHPGTSTCLNYSTWGRWVHALVDIIIGIFLFTVLDSG